jgi:hypothetical protein
MFLKNAVIPGSPASVINDAINVKFVLYYFCKIMFSSIAGGIDVALVYPPKFDAFVVR